MRRPPAEFVGRRVGLISGMPRSLAIGTSATAIEARHRADDLATRRRTARSAACAPARRSARRRGPATRPASVQAARRVQVVGRQQGAVAASGMPRSATRPDMPPMKPMRTGARRRRRPGPGADPEGDRDAQPLAASRVVRPWRAGSGCVGIGAAQTGSGRILPDSAAVAVAAVQTTTGPEGPVRSSRRPRHSRSPPKMPSSISSDWNALIRLR